MAQGDGRYSASVKQHTGAQVCVYGEGGGREGGREEVREATPPKKEEEWNAIPKRRRGSSTTQKERPGALPNEREQQMFSPLSSCH